MIFFESVKFANDLLEIVFAVKYEALERQSEVHSGQNLEKEVEELKLRCKNVEVVASIASYYEMYWVSSLY